MTDLQPMYPTGPGQASFFKNANDAFARVREIYDHNCAFLKQSFAQLVAGAMPPAKVVACYPYVAITVADVSPIDTRMSFGFVSGPGRYSTTLTRPDIYKNYYIQQFDQLIKNHDVAIEVGISKTPIPIHFVFHDGMHIEGALGEDKVRALHEKFCCPDLSVMDDAIANGTHHPGPGHDKPLSLFTAPRVDYSLLRLRHYTGTDPADFQNYVIFTNYQFYVDEFVRLGRMATSDAPHELLAQTYDRLVEPTILPGKNGSSVKTQPQMPAYHLTRSDNAGVTIINIGVGPSNARNISDHIAVLRPDAWMMLGHCAGLRRSQRLGDYVLAHAYVRDDHALDAELPVWVPVPALAEVQRAIEAAVAKVTCHEGYDIKSIMRTGTVVTTDNRNWEISGYDNLVERFSQSRAIAMDMESAVIAANGFRFRVPYGTLLCVSDRPLHGEIKLPGMANDFYHQQVSQHLLIGLIAIEILHARGQETLHSRKLRSFSETAFQ